MKLLALLTWVTQFGLSIIFPALIFLGLGAWLRARFGLGLWIMAALGILGILTSVSTAKSCLRSMRKAAEELSDRKEPPIAFNDHQ